MANSTPADAGWGNAVELDYHRALNRVPSFPQRGLAAFLRISQPSLNSVLKTAAKVPPPRPGFSGASPHEIERYAAKLISREHVIDELSRWEYAAAAPQVDDFDWLQEDKPGSFEDVVKAFREGLLEPEVYDAVLEANDKVPARWSPPKRRMLIELASSRSPSPVNR